MGSDSQMRRICDQILMRLKNSEKLKTGEDLETGDTRCYFYKISLS